MKKNIKIGLLWHSMTSDNLGVGALTESQIAICDAVAAGLDLKPEYLVIGTVGGKSWKRYEDKVTIGNPVSIRKTILGGAPYLDDLAKCDVVLDIGEGDSFTDIYGMYRFAFLWGSKYGVLSKKVPLVLSPQTIGPFDKPMTGILAKWAMRRCEAVFARDGLSRDFLKKLGVRDNAFEAIDVAFRLPYDKPAEKVNELGPLRVGVNVSGLLMSGGYTGNNQFGLTIDYPALIRRLLAHLQGRGDCEVWLVPHVVPNDETPDNDLPACRKLAAEFPGCHVSPVFQSASEAKTFIAALDFMTGARMHACIAAISSGVAVVPVSYSRKFNGLFSSLEYPWMADGRVDSTDAAFNKIVEGLQNRSRLRSAAVAANALAQSKLRAYEQFLTTTFERLRR